MEEERRKIIVENFFRILKEKNISQKKFAKDNYLDPSIVSKWKKDYSINIDYFDMALKYLDIKYYELYYSPQEQKRLAIEELTIPFEPIEAQQHVKIKRYENVLSSPFKVIICFLVMIIFIFIYLLLFTKEYSVYPVVLISLSSMISILITKVAVTSKIYIINYLDEIYFYMKNSKNQYLKKQYLLRSLIVLITLILMVIMLFFYQKDFNIYYSVCFACAFAFFIYSIYFIITTKRKYKEKIYNFELNDYHKSVYQIGFSVCLLISFFILFFIDFSKFSYYIVGPILIVILSIIDFCYVSKKNMEYKLYIYQEEKKQARSLFENN